MILILCAGLLAAVFVVFGQTIHFGFIDYDDDVYVYENPVVTHGLTPGGILWAFTFDKIGHWHPLTWFSHMLDCQLYGLNAGGHHFTNVLLHAANAILLFLVLQKMMSLCGDQRNERTSRPGDTLWPSAFASVIFAIHPLRVESVAWVSERKDVLAGFFFMLTLWAYTRYVQSVTGKKRSTTGTETTVASSNPLQTPRQASLYYGLVVSFFALGLLAKGMLITLPFLLLLLDYWPLSRLQPTTPRAAFAALRPFVIEKIPLFALSALSAVATGLASEKFVIADKLPVSLGLENAFLSYTVYLWQMLYPVGLAIPYPNPIHGLPLWKVVSGLILLVVLSYSAVVLWKRCPYLLVGWSWYLGALVPVTGFVQISYYAHADRYTYLPQIGLYVAIVWAIRDLTASWRYRVQLLTPVAGAIIAVYMACAWKQTTYWRNDETLWKHTLACTSGNYVAHNNLGYALAWEARPASADRIAEAIEHFQKAVEINPRFPEAHFNLGILLAEQGWTNAAIEQYQTGLAFEPDNAKVHCKLADIYFAQEHWGEAVEHYQQALKQMPGSIHAHYQMGVALQCQKQFGAAVAEFQKVLELDPQHVAAQNDLAWIWATCPEASLRNGPKAVELAQQAIQLSSGNQPELLDTLAVAYAEAGQFPEAIETTRQALNLLTSKNNQQVAEALQMRLKLYEAKVPFHEKP